MNINLFKNNLPSDLGFRWTGSPTTTRRAGTLHVCLLTSPDMKRSGAHSALLLARSGTACVPQPLGDLYEPSVAHRIAAYTGVRHHGHASRPWSGTNTPWATYSSSAGTAAKATRTVVWKGINFGRRARSLGLPKQFKQNFVMEWTANRRPT